ncbi:hypothetical protein niasHT_000612 [Heterodera trifolii]|uniref:Lon proteolytic domain-containing protein n=1 Tax=Heterodera trifolii TaxID=157864 RepID=A0ABD2LZ59_9BILA
MMPLVTVCLVPRFPPNWTSPPLGLECESSTSTVAKEIFEDEYANDFFESTRIDVLAPPEAEMIYGPSASVAIFIALYALATGRKVRDGPTLTGEVLPDKSVTRIGGLRQKVKAAAKSGKKRIILTVENERVCARLLLASGENVG